MHGECEGVLKRLCCSAERNRLNIHESKRVGGDDIDVVPVLSNTPGRVLTLRVCIFMLNMRVCLCVFITAHTESTSRILFQQKNTMYIMNPCISV